MPRTFLSPSLLKALPRRLGKLWVVRVGSAVTIFSRPECQSSPWTVRDKLEFQSSRSKGCYGVLRREYNTPHSLCRTFLGADAKRTFQKITEEQNCAVASCCVCQPEWCFYWHAISSRGWFWSGEWVSCLLAIWLGGNHEQETYLDIGWHRWGFQCYFNSFHSPPEELNYWKK